MEKNCGRGISLTRGPVGSGLLLRLVELGLVDAVHLRRLVAHGSVRAGKKTPDMISDAVKMQNLDTP